ncbi:MAG: hypothetical protein KA146_09745 [Leptospiraceae bacterium]|nr:hypothetical protein [Leptospiraceae bacterium]
MAILLILFFIGLPILLGIGLWKPQLVLRWETEPTKKKFLLYWFGITVVLFIIMVALTPIVFSTESNPKNSEITTLSEITFTGKGRVEAILTINSQPVKIVDKAYSVKFPLALGDNEFKIEYEFEGKKESKVIKVSRISEQEYKAQQNKIEAEKKLAAKKEEDETKKAELENKKYWDEQRLKEEKEGYKKTSQNERLEYGANTTVAGNAACQSKEYLDDIISARNQNNTENVHAMIAQQKCIILKDGIPVTITNNGFLKIEFMYNGYKFWAVREAVRR